MILKRILFSFSFFLLFSCQNFGQLKMLGDLPNTLKEVSGNEFLPQTKAFWVLEDGGNSSKIYQLSTKGKVTRVLDIKKKNNDWEDLTSDNEGNLYIGDFGNNNNERKNLKILKVAAKDTSAKEATVIEFEFEYENQDKFPPKKKFRFFDAESFFYFNNHFYVFTKSRVNKAYGKTWLYKIPAIKGKHKAQLIGYYNNCDDEDCWITSADISSDGKTVVLLSQKNVLLFSDFKNDDFLSGKVKKIPLEHRSQKEGVCFKDVNTLLITDERSGGTGGNIYELKI
jgi:hypothetical protein